MLGWESNIYVIINPQREKLRDEIILRLGDEIFLGLIRMTAHRFK